MDFKKATDELCEPVSHEQLAGALGCSVASLRQARLDPSAKAHRRPPKGWQAATAKLAESKAGRLRKLAMRLLAEQSENER